jgi:pimeloyl-ACP methyl ester carboxylesterase
MGARIEGAGVELAYEERGSGPAVLLVHGMADAAAGWEPAAQALAAQARVIAYDRRGYGASGAPEPYERTTVEEQAEDAAALLRGLRAGPAVACGRDVGALACLDLARRHRALVRGVVLADPALYQLVPEATEALSAERIALEEALRDGGPGRAVEWWLATRGAPAARVRRARADSAAFFADYASIGSWPVRRRDLRAFDLPAAVLVSPRAPAYVRATAAALAGLLPGVGRAEELDPVQAVRRVLAA